MSTKKRHHQTLILGLIASLAVPVAQAQDGLTKTLIEQGQYWQSRGDAQRAAETWEKLLRVDPKQPEALYGMARARLQEQQLDEAQRYLEQLRRAHPNHRLVARLQQEITVQNNSAQLQQARNLARSGQSDQAVSNYQSVLGDKAPTGPLALEYYQTLGGTSGGWDQARRGLERLARESPDDPQISLALAQHLTYREATRREGISQLARLSNHPDVGKAATESWRKALAWTGSRTADIPLYEAYLRVYPKDEAVQARLREVQAGQRAARAEAAAARDPLRLRTTEGFKALEDGDLEAAEADFQSVLKDRPNDADALGGMGVLRLRQEEFAQARNYLERAMRQGSPARWKQSFDSATYWTLVEQAQTARDAGDTETARQFLEQAVRIDPREITAENNLADVLAESGKLEAAEAAYRRVLLRQVDNPDAMRGLVGVLSQTGKAAEALQLVERLTPSQQEKVGALGRLRAAQAMGQARAAADRGDDNAARVALEDALLNDPGNPWVRLDLARLYLKMGAKNEARGVMDGLLVSNPNMPEALYASALLASEARDWTGALTTLERIPEKNRTRDIAALQRRVWVQVQADAAALLGRQGQVQQAQALLAQVEPFVGKEADLLGTLALAYADAGDPNRALAMVREMLARTPRPDTGLRLQYAATLLKTQQDVELAGILRQLQETPMSAQDRRSYEDIRVGYILRQADTARTAGDLAAAYDRLAPLLSERPNDPEVVNALARMYTDHGDHAQAMALYNRLLEKEPRNLKLLLSAANAAVSTKDFAYAESALLVMQQLAPNDPEVLTTAGRIYRAKGQLSKAGQYFAAAIESENRARTALLAATGQPGTPLLGALPGSNPFRTAVPSSWAGGRTPFPAAASTAVGAMLVPGYTAGQPVSAASASPAYIPPPAGVARFPVPPTPVSSVTTPANYFSGAAGPAPTAVLAAPPAAPAAPAAILPRQALFAQVDVTASRAALSRATTPPPAVAMSRQVVSSVPVAPPAAPMPSSASSPVTGYMTPQAASYVTAQATPATPSLWGMTPSASPPAAPAPSTARPRSAVDDLTELNESRTPMLSVGVQARSRQGEAGMGQMTDLAAPVELKINAGDGMMSFRITPVGVGAGTPETSYGALSRFGGGPVTALDMPTRSPGSQSASGVGIGAAYETVNLKLDLGTLPLGFGQTDIMGGVRYRMDFSDQVALTGELSRRPVTDSVLSFAGARDARTGERWGAVSANGARLDLTWDDGSFGTYVNGGLHSLVGQNVQSNSRAELSGGMYWHIHRETDSRFTAGLNFTGLSYDKNLRYFTYGQGGYFSPQQFLAMSVPFDWAQRSGRLTYEIKGALGVQYFKEDPSAYFPGNRTRQTAAAQAALDAAAFGEAGATNLTATYPGQSKTGLGYNLGMAMEYQMHPQLFIGGSLAMDNARDYRQFSGGLYVRYALQPYLGRPSLPVKTLKSPYAF